MGRLLTAPAIMTATAALASPALACWEDAARHYGLSPQLLYAVAQVESGLDARAVNRSHLERTGSYDIGLMQINSRHLGTLARHGIDEAALYEPCTNIRVGAWILADNFARHGTTWEAVGAYNAACSRLKGTACVEARSRYAWKVFRRLSSRPLQPMAGAEALRPGTPSPASRVSVR